MLICLWRNLKLYQQFFGVLTLVLTKKLNYRTNVLSVYYYFVYGLELAKD